MDVLTESRAAAFVLEAGKTLMLDQPQDDRPGQAKQNHFSGENMRIGVIGTGAMGSNHLRVLRSTPAVPTDLRRGYQRARTWKRTARATDIEKLPTTGRR